MPARERIDECNFVKAVSAIGIVIFHFAIETGTTALLPGRYAWGSVFVTVFFMVSGALLYHNYGRPADCKLFYYKRWKSLMPDFYIAFLGMYAVQVIKHRSLFYNGRPASLLLTLIGMDGYLYDVIPNYYILGEWFLGAIIILYILYPLLAYLIDRNQFLTLMALLILYAGTFFMTSSLLSDFRSVPSCALSFAFGMMIARSKLYRERRLLVPAFIVFTAGNFLFPEGEFNLSSHVEGAALFFVLFILGGWVLKSRQAKKAVDFVSGISYDIFLVHHVMLMQIIKMLPENADLLMHVLVLLGGLIVIIGAAFIFSKICLTIKMQ